MPVLHYYIMKYCSTVVSKWNGNINNASTSLLYNETLFNSGIKMEWQYKFAALTIVCTFLTVIRCKKIEPVYNLIIVLLQRMNSLLSFYYPLIYNGALVCTK